MSYNTTEAIVLRQYDFGEADKIVAFYTKQFGKLRAVAKGVRKTKCRFGSSMEPFSYVDIILYMQKRKDLYVVTGASILDSHKKLRENLDWFITASYIVELLDKLTEPEEPNNRLFSLVEDTFYQIPRQERDTVLTIFSTKFLTLLGYKLSLEKCVVCRQDLPFPERRKLSIQQGGVLCSKCISEDTLAIDVSPVVTKYLERLISVDLRRLGRVTIRPEVEKELKKVVQLYLAHYLSSRLKTEEFIEKITTSQIRG